MRASAARANRSTLRRATRWGFQLVLFCLIVYFWQRYLSAHWQEVAAIRWSLPWQSCVIALLFTLTGYLIRGASWGPLRREFVGKRLSLLSAFRISALAWAGRYIPGKVWAVGFRAYLSSASQDEIGQNTVAAAIDTIWFELSGVVLVMVLGSFWGLPAGPLDQLSWVGPVVITLALIGCHPRVFYPVSNRLLRLSRQTPLPRPPRFGAMLLLLTANVTTFLLIGTGFGVLVREVAGLPLAALGVIIGVFVAAWVAGFFALFAPGGLGVRETVLGVGLGQLLGLDPGSVVTRVVASRALVIVAELLCFVAALALTPFVSSPQRATQE